MVIAPEKLNKHFAATPCVRSRQIGGDWLLLLVCVNLEYAWSYCSERVRKTPATIVREGQSEWSG